MAQQTGYIGNFGPYIYDDAKTYSDGKQVTGARVNKMMVDEAPVDDLEVTNKAYVDSVSVGSRIAIGGLYLNVTGVNPAVELGYGTWTLHSHGTLTLT